MVKSCDDLSVASPVCSMYTVYVVFLVLLN